MAETFLRYYNPELTVESAGTHPSHEVHPLARQMMSEVNMPMTEAYPKNVDSFLEQPWDFVITVCGGAQETCPAFLGAVKQRQHIGFDDPAGFTGSEAEILTGFRRVRDEIMERFTAWHREHVAGGARA
jgi:arsenate reductase